MHFGKSGHFRKEGIGIPQNIYKDDLQRLFAQIQFFKPSSVIITGDMFHSEVNKEINFFLKWRNDISHVRFILVKGNHDILKNDFYSKSDIQVFEKKLSIGNFCFTHDITESCEEDRKSFYTFSGHIHPGIRVNGPGRQSLKLPCYYFGKDYSVLPAFSLFTGLAKILPSASDHVFALVEDTVVELKGF